MQTALSLLAFGFTNLAMLGWLAAAAAPLLIHLWSRHRFREAPWAAMQFLLAAMRKNARRLQLQQWVLLAVRTLLIVLIVLAAAEPYRDQLVAGGTSGPAHKVLVIDGSYSMGYRHDAETNFARAKKLANSLVRESRPGDTFTVILMAKPARIIVGREAIDHATIVTQIESLPQIDTGADLPSALALVEEALASLHKTPAISARQEVYFFTDLQRSTWQPAVATSALGSDRETVSANPRSNNNRSTRRQPAHQPVLTSLAERAAVVIIDVGQPVAENLAVTRFETSDALVTIDRDIAFEATLRRFGQHPQSQVAVELLVDDVPVSEQTVEIPTDSDAAVRFSHRFTTSREHTLVVRATNDRLPVDNTRRLVVPVREAIRVLCVAGREGAARYVADALMPNPAAPSSIEPTIVSEGDLAELELSEFDCVFLCNAAQLTASEADRLTRYARAGGGVVFFLGDRVIPDAYNQFARGTEPSAVFSSPSAKNLQPAQNLPSQALLPARIGPLVSPSQLGLDPLDYRHPIVAPFRGRERAGLLTTPIKRYYQLDTSQKRPGVEIAAALRGGDPFIVTSPLGRGRTVLVATDGSLSSIDSNSGEPWTTWPTWPSFLPIVREMLAYAIGGQHEEWQRDVGESFGGPIGTRSPGTSPAELQITRPDGRTAPVHVEISPGDAQWSYDDTDLSGIYSLHDSAQNGTGSFAVNVDTTESNLTKIDRRLLPRQVSVRDTWQDSSDDLAGSTISRASWNEQLLWFALGLLFVESFLAWRFGRGGA